MIFLDKFFFEKIRLIFDIQNWLWKYNFGTFWQTVITRRNFLKIFPWWHVDSWPKRLLFRTHHLWNSTTKLILLNILTCTIQIISTFQIISNKTAGMIVNVKRSMKPLKYCRIDQVSIQRCCNPILCCCPDFLSEK